MTQAGSAVRALTRGMSLCLVSAQLAACSDLLARLLPQPAPTGGPPAIDLAPPPPGQGVQIRLAGPSHTGGQDLEQDLFRKLAVADAVQVNRIQVAHGPGVHHLLMLKSDSEDVADHEAPATDPSLYDKYDVIGGAAEDSLDWQLPPGVGLRLSPRQQLSFRAHYVLVGEQGGSRPSGEVAVNFWFARPGAATQPLGVLLAECEAVQHSDAGADLHSSVSFAFDREVHVVGATAAAHARARRFGITDLPAGEQTRTLFKTRDWEDPLFQTIPDLGIPPGATVSFTTEFAGDEGGEGGHEHGADADAPARLALFFYPADPDRYAVRVGKAGEEDVPGDHFEDGGHSGHSDQSGH